MILPRTSVSKRFAIALRNPVRYTFPLRHSVARSSCKIAEPQNRNARVNNRMHVRTGNIWIAGPSIGSFGSQGHPLDELLFRPRRRPFLSVLGNSKYPFLDIRSNLYTLPSSVAYTRHGAIHLTDDVKVTISKIVKRHPVDVPSTDRSFGPQYS